MEPSLQDSLFLNLAAIVANAQADDLQVRRQLPYSREKYVKDKTSLHLQNIKKRFLSWEEHIQKAATLLQAKLNILSFDKRKKLLEEINQFTSQKKKPSEIFLSWLYKEAYEHYEQRDWIEALSLFYLLSSLSPLTSDFWLGLGFIQKQLEQNSDALCSFSLAVLLNPSNNTAHYQLAELYFAQKQYGDALIEISALAQAPPSPEISELENKILNKQSGGL